MATETDALQKVVNHFAKSLENNSQTDAIFLDFSRAFDVVPHERLLLKMNYYGVRKYLPWIRNFLSQRKQCVVIDGVQSRSFQGYLKELYWQLYYFLFLSMTCQNL